MHPIVILLLFLILAVMIVGGLAAYLKLKLLWMRIAGMFSFGIGLFLLCASTIWLRTIAPGGQMP